MARAWDIHESPIGPLTLEGGDRGLRTVRFPTHGAGGTANRAGEREPGALRSVRAALDAYFAGELREFVLELDLRGDADELRVWRALREVPYGETVSYAELGREAGVEDPRDVGRIVGSTPTPIVVPCHRVIGTDGTLRGYGGGLDRKRFLLELERRVARPAGPPPDWALTQLELV